MRLICYPLTDRKPQIRPAPSERAWMDATPQSYAYRCLPLNIANSHGWEILCPVSFEARWDGGVEKSAIQVQAAPDQKPTALSHFGSGVLTFELGCLFRTEPGYNMFVTGPLNRPKDGIAPLSGVIETDWSVATFTMNYRFLRPDHTVKFEEGEPIAVIFPLKRGLLETFEPEFRGLDEDPQLMREFDAWRQSRVEFLEDLSQPNSSAVKEKWQKTYYRGQLADGGKGTEDHYVKLRLKPFGSK